MTIPDEQSTLDNLLNRLNKLERSNRRLKAVGTFVLAVFLTAMIMGQAPRRPKLIEAERFVVRDSAGKERIVIGDLTPSILREKPLVSGRPGYGISILNDFDASQDFGFSGSTTTKLTRFGLSFTKFSETSDEQLAKLKKGIALHDALGRSEIGYNGIYVYGQNLTTQQAFLGMNYNRPALIVSDADGKPRVAVGSVELEDQKTGTLTTQPASIVLFGKDGNALWRVPQ